MRARRQKQFELAGALREQGQPWHAIAELLRADYQLNARVAMRIAHGWTQADAATEWNLRWPDEPETFKNFSYWEAWPSRTGYMPSLTTLGRLAELYECDVGDLLADWGSHRVRDRALDSSSRTGGRLPALAWQIENLSLAELVRALDSWDISSAIGGDQAGIIAQTQHCRCACRDCAASFAAGCPGLS